jgi:hypothetical protein
MKKCTYCGKEYSDEAHVCETDGERLVDENSPNPSPLAKSDQNLVGFRGWLLFFAIIIYLNLMMGITAPAFICAGVAFLFDRPADLNLIFALFLYGIPNTVMYIWFWFVAIQVRNKRSTAPKAMIKFLKVQLVVSGVALAIGMVWAFFCGEHVDPSQILVMLIYGFIGSCGGVLIWVNYLNKSKRVKATFVN